MARKTTDFIVIHCSATPPSMDIGVREIDRWHRAKGWLRVGYHYVIRRNGKVEFGRAPSACGAHVKGYNDVSVGVCMIGGVSAGRLKRAEKNFTPEQWVALEKLVDLLVGFFPDAKVVGHTDLDPKKKCPSFNVKEWLNARQIDDVQGDHQPRED